MVLSNKVAVVTGGNGGIGRAIAVELAREGAAVVVNYVHDPAAAEVLTQRSARAAARRSPSRAM